MSNGSSGPSGGSKPKEPCASTRYFNETVLGLAPEDRDRPLNPAPLPRPSGKVSFSDALAAFKQREEETIALLRSAPYSEPTEHRPTLTKAYKAKRKREAAAKLAEAAAAKQQEPKSDQHAYETTKTRIDKAGAFDKRILEPYWKRNAEVHRLAQLHKEFGQGVVEATKEGEGKKFSYLYEDLMKDDPWGEEESQEEMEGLGHLDAFHKLAVGREEM